MNWQKTFAPVLILVAGIAIGYTMRGAMLKENNKTVFVMRLEGEYKHINPLLACDVADSIITDPVLLSFQKKIDVYLKNSTDKNLATSVSVYFRELNDGLHFGIADTESFAPASLRKVPLMIALLKQNERMRGGNLLGRKVKFDLSNDYNTAQNIKPSQRMVPGRMYAVGDLLYRMIVYSDNNAFTLLTSIVDPAELNSVYSKLRMLNPQSIQEDEFLSVQTYASFYRVLYNATYLSKEASDWALNILSLSEFKAGLVAGAPPDIVVSHKFGEHSDDDAGTVQLHDCGIVYYPQHPYLLCIMSKGQNFESLAEVISGISRITYTGVDSQHGKR